MKNLLIRVFWPILRFFEENQEPASYRPSHRIALNVVGILFLVLSCGVAYAVQYSNDVGFFIPIVVFFCLGSVALIVGTLGTDGAVAKIWGSKK